MRGWSVLLLACTALGVLSCAERIFAPSPGEGPRQSWSEHLGPVIPHDRFPGDCSLCHVGANWHTMRAEFRFDHARETGVPLAGAHAAARCLRCHNDRGPVAQFAARGCAGCHEDPHRGHLGSACSECHDEADWIARGARADHVRTRFPLTGAHVAAPCSSCHAGANAQNFEGADLACESCHAADLDRARTPDHRIEGWTSDCARCHLTRAWSDARFQHRTEDFDCVRCHREDFERARTPDHLGGGYPTTCTFCHYGDVTWSGGYFVHHWFPIVSGIHGGHACNVCHVGRDVFAHASCLVCHEHNPRRMARDHADVRGYVYESDQCWVCHPEGTVVRR